MGTDLGSTYQYITNQNMEDNDLWTKAFDSSCAAITVDVVGVADDVTGDASGCPPRLNQIGEILKNFVQRVVRRSASWGERFQMICWDDHRLSRIGRDDRLSRIRRDDRLGMIRSCSCCARCSWREPNASKFVFQPSCRRCWCWRITNIFPHDRTWDQFYCKTIFMPPSVGSVNDVLNKFDLEEGAESFFSAR